MSGRFFRASLIFAVLAFSGCSLVEQVVVIEHRKEAVKLSAASSGSVSIAQGPGKRAATGQAEKEALSKASSARFDSGPVLKPINKKPENKSAEPREDSAFVSAVKSWVKSGMQFPGWIGSQ